MERTIKNFIFNDFLVSVKENDWVKVFTNDLTKQKEAKELEDFFNGKHGNKVSICFNTREEVRKYFSITEKINNERFRVIHNSGISRTLESNIISDGVVTIYTCNGFLQLVTRRAYAERNNFKIYNVEKIRIL